MDIKRTRMDKKMQTKNFISIKKTSLVLAIFAFFSTSIVAITYQLTKNKIIQQEQLQLQIKIDQVLPKNLYNNNLLTDKKTITTQTNNLSNNVIIYLAYKNNNPVGAVIKASTPNGYNGDISFILGLNYQGEITGVRILKHKETPGLGDKIDYKITHWVDDFIGKTPKNSNDPLWAVKKDGGEFDQFTGATITPRAIVNAIKKIVLYYKTNKDNLFNLNGNTK